MSAMRRRVAWPPLLLMGMCAGCASTATEGPERIRLTNRPIPSGGVVMDVVVVERALGDPYVNDGLWSSADAHVVAADQKATVQSNGFRVGQLIGLPPVKLQELLTNDRYAVKRERVFLPSGGSKSFALGPTQPVCDAQIALESGAFDVHLDNAQAFLIIAPTLTSDGKTRLRFTPQIQYGECTTQITPSPEHSRWQFDYERPKKTFAELSWHVTLPPNAYLLIGASVEDSGTLAYQSFAPLVGMMRKQRLLVVRTSRALGESEGASSDQTAAQASGSSVPLVLLAGGAKTKVRGSGTR